MQYDESAALGERLLEQALKAAGHMPAEIDTASWERAVRDSGAHSRQEVLADIGLGRRLPAVLARRLLRKTEREEAKSGPTKSATQPDA